MKVSDVVIGMLIKLVDQHIDHEVLTLYVVDLVFLSFFNLSSVFISRVLTTMKC
jgi:hypothetical protein